MEKIGSLELGMNFYLTNDPVFPKEGQRRFHVGNAGFRLGLLFPLRTPFVMTSKNEGLGRAFIEAQASGVPVIGTRVGGVAEVLDPGKTGLLVEAGDVQGLADALALLAADQSLRGRMSQACRPWVVPRFSAAVMVDKIEDIYLRLLSGNVRDGRAAG